MYSMAIILCNMYSSIAIWRAVCFTQWSFNIVGSFGNWHSKIHCCSCMTPVSIQCIHVCVVVEMDLGLSGGWEGVRGTRVYSHEHKWDQYFFLNKNYKNVSFIFYFANSSLTTEIQCKWKWTLWDKCKTKISYNLKECWQHTEKHSNTKCCLHNLYIWRKQNVALTSLLFLQLFFRFFIPVAVFSAHSPPFPLMHESLDPADKHEGWALIHFLPEGCGDKLEADSVPPLPESAVKKNTSASEMEKKKTVPVFLLCKWWTEQLKTQLRDWIQPLDN